MSLTSLLVHDVTILTPATTTGRYGDSVKDWDNATATATKGWIARTSQSEVNGVREAEVSEWQLFLSVDDTITARDRVTWNGRTFEVDGPPVHAWTPRGEHHLEVPLSLVVG